MKNNPAASLTELGSPGFNLTLSLATNLINLWVFFPWTHEVLAVYMGAKKDSADKETIAKARMNFGIVHGICNIINYITMGANLFFLYQVTAVQKNCVYCDKMYGYYQRACVLFIFSDSFLEQEFQNKTLILTKRHIQTFNEKPIVT